MEAAPATVDTAIAAAVEKLSAPQRRAWGALLVERLVRLLCGRQAGKTYLVALWLLAGAMLVSGSVNVYLALTKESAKRAIWPELLLVGGMLGIPPECFKLHGGVVSLPNGSTVLVMGTDDRATIETWRGSKLNRVAIDEMGSQPPEWIAYMVREIVWWCIMRHEGAIALLGTPGLLPDGYWYEQTKPELRDDPALHSWTVFDNPGIPHAQGFIDETLRLNGWTTTTPQYIREVLGQWNNDASAAVYPYDDERNGLDALPLFGVRDAVIAPAAWSYIVAANVADAERVSWAVWAWHKEVAGAIAVEGISEMADPDAAVERLAAVIKRHPNARCIVDPGELGEQHVLSMRRRWRLPATSAVKNEKPSAIRDLRGGVLSGAVKVLRGDATRDLRDAWKVTGWHPKRPVHDPARPDMLASAAAFGYRRVPPHAPPPVLEHRSSAWLDDLIARTERQVKTSTRARGVGAVERLGR